MNLVGIDANTIVIEIGEQKEIINIDQMFHIDEADLTSEYAQQSALYARISLLTTQAEYEYVSAKFKAEQEYAESDEAAREDFQKEDKKYTEAVIRSQVLMDAAYCDAIDKENEAERLFKALKAIAFALQQRADMLVSMGAHMRAEMEMTGMNIKERNLEKSIEEAKQITK